MTLINAIVANSPTGGDLAGTFGGGNNLIDDTSGTSGTLTGSRNITGKPALLAPLGNYGGPTETIALLPGSPAIDAGDDTVCAATGPGTVNNLDQRGVARPVGAHCGIGSFESQGFTFTARTGDRAEHHRDQYGGWLQRGGEWRRGDECHRLRID